MFYSPLCAILPTAKPADTAFLQNVSHIPHLEYKLPYAVLHDLIIVVSAGTTNLKLPSSWLIFFILSYLFSRQYPHKYRLEQLLSFYIYLVNPVQQLLIVQYAIGQKIQKSKRQPIHLINGSTGAPFPSIL